MVGLHPSRVTSARTDGPAVGLNNTLKMCVANPESDLVNRPSPGYAARGGSEERNVRDVGTEAKQWDSA
jgi:hypothetical protein